MALTAFNRHLGRGQGRTESSNGGLFVLGDERPGHFFELVPGDYAEVAQQTDLTGVDLIRTHLELRVPESLPSALGWEASLTVNGTKYASAICTSGRSRALSDLTANVSKLTGLHEIGVRLELVEV